MKFFISVSIILLCSQFYVESKDYCKQNLCSNVIHVGCIKDYSTSPNSKIIDLKDYEDFIVEEHNVRRNKIASGEIPPFPAATKMIAMAWDSDLAKLAELQLLTYKTDHDQCHNTEKFRQSGQNLAQTVNSGELEIESFLTTSIEMWYNEHKNTTLDMIRYLPEDLLIFNDIGHFTELVRDDNTHVGCAMMVNYDSFLYLLTCNYATCNMPKKLTYDYTGPVGSKCENGKHPTYKNLCNQKIF